MGGPMGGPVSGPMPSTPVYGGAMANYSWEEPKGEELSFYALDINSISDLI